MINIGDLCLQIVYFILRFIKYWVFVWQLVFANFIHVIIFFLKLSKDGNGTTRFWQLFLRYQSINYCCDHQKLCNRKCQIKNLVHNEFNLHRIIAIEFFAGGIHQQHSGGHMATVPVSMSSSASDSDKPAKQKRHRTRWGPKLCRMCSNTL